MGKYIFANKLMFAIIMRDPIACKKFIEMIFPERTVEKILFPNKAEEDGGAATINEIAVEVEKTIITGIASKSVRLDVLFKGDDTVYDIEMQLETGRRNCKAEAATTTWQSPGIRLRRGRLMRNSRPGMSSLCAVLILLRGTSRFTDLKCMIKIYSCN